MVILAGKKRMAAAVAVAASFGFQGLELSPAWANSSEQSVVGKSPTSTEKEVPPPHVTSIRGLIRDIACAVQNPKAEARDFNLPCAEACALAGSPLIVQTDNGTLYIPISQTIPDTDQRPKLMPFVGKFVEVRGRVYERRGTRVITLESIKELTDVKLKIEK